MHIKKANSTVCPQPGCGAKARTVKTDQVTPEFRTLTYMCTNEECKCIFVASITVDRIISPSLLEAVTGSPPSPAMA